MKRSDVSLIKSFSTSFSPTVFDSVLLLYQVKNTPCRKESQFLYDILLLLT